MRQYNCPIQDFPALKGISKKQETSEFVLHHNNRKSCVKQHKILLSPSSSNSCFHRPIQWTSIHELDGKLQAISTAVSNTPLVKWLAKVMKQAKPTRRSHAVSPPALFTNLRYPAWWRIESPRGWQVDSFLATDMKSTRKGIWKLIWICVSWTCPFGERDIQRGTVQRLRWQGIDPKRSWMKVEVVSVALLVVPGKDMIHYIIKKEKRW